MKCTECSWYYTEENETYPRCHYDDDWRYKTPWDKAPCEYEEEPPSDWQDEC